MPFLRRGVAAALVLVLWTPGPLPLRAREETAAGRWKATLGLEYHFRTIAWDQKTRFSRLDAAVLLAGIRLQVIRGWHASAVLGCGLSDWSGLVFRNLPFSVDYEAGYRAGITAGGGLETHLVRFGSWDIGMAGRLLASFGSRKTLSLSGLNEEGRLDVRGRWMRVQAGPVVTYRSSVALATFFKASFDRLWGAFTMAETIGELDGTEEKAVVGRSWVSISGGLLWEPSPAFGLGLEGTVFPYRRAGGGVGLDAGAALRASAGF